METTTILIVEDEAIVAADLESKLRRNGYAVVGIASSGEEAIEIVQTQSPHLILMDIELEGRLDGIETARTIQTQYDVPVVYLTADSDQTTLSRAKRTNPFGYIIKPFDERDLATQVQLALHRHQTEQQLRRSEVFVKNVLAAALNGIYVFDLKSGRNTFINPEYTKLTGYALDAINNMNAEAFSALIHPEDQSAMTAHMEALGRAMDGEVLEIEYRFKCADGDWIWCFSRESVFARNAEGAVSSVIGCFLDITDRKNSEERTRREHSETLFANRVLRAFVEHEGDELFDQALAVVQEEMASMHGVFGYIPEPGHLHCPSLSKTLDACEMEGKCIHYPPEKWKGLWARALKEKRSFYTNEAPPVPPGHLIIHNNLAAPILFQGDVIGLLNIANKDGGYTDSDRDTLDRIADRIAPVLYAWIQRKLREDDRKAARAEVEQLAQQRQLALDSARLGWWQFDPNTRDVQFDDNCKNIFGLSGNTRHIEKILRQIIHQEDLPLLIARVEAALDPVEPQPYATEIRIIRPDGQMRWVEAHGSATFEGDGTNRSAERLFGTVQDITERKEAQTSLKRLNKKLEQQVAERTAELHNRAKKLQSLAIQLSEAEDLERQRIAQLLHDDLQQHLVAVKMKLYAIEPDFSGRREAEEVIGRCIDLLGGAVEKTRKLSRDLSPVAHRPRGLLDGMGMLADQFKEDYGLAVEVSHTENSEPGASAINRFLFQAVKELLFNVVKHSGATTANVHVVETRGHIEIRVADDGKGGDLEQVYARRGVEPGFGLFSIEERIHALGGEVTIESVPGDGWVTTLTVPKTAQVDSKISTSARGDDAAAVASRNLPGSVKRPPKKQWRRQNSGER